MYEELSYKGKMSPAYFLVPIKMVCSFMGKVEDHETKAN